MRLRSFFVLFLVSGFCSLVDQVVWLRLAMAQFGVTTALVSIMLTVFMGGLALGSWLAGRWARARETGSPATSLRLYAAAELVIGSGALVVPPLLSLGRAMLALSTGGEAWGSLGHHVGAGLWLAVVLLPFCMAMGATLPLAMLAIRQGLGGDVSRSFSYLYLANVMGATLGSLASAFVLIELLGFRRTLLVAAALNIVLAAWAFRVSRSVPPSAPHPAPPANETRLPSVPSGAAVPALLFASGLASMGMEVVWVRQFTPYLGTVVYAFALIVGVYLTATALGSAAYRYWSATRPADPLRASWAWLWTAAAVCGLLPVLGADPRLPLGAGLATGLLRLGLGVAPFCALAGFATPLLLDRWSGGDASRAGTAYAVNILGCILGPVLAAFALLPAMAERWALLALVLPMWILGVSLAPAARQRLAAGVALAAGAVTLLTATRDFESVFPRRQVRRDATATVTATGEGMDKRLLVNGVGMTELSPATKMMAHLPLAFRSAPPRDVLVICFGMGTSFRSALTWGARVTVVELVPSVPRLFDYYHPDGSRLLRSPTASVVIDDGRRFLERHTGPYDAVIVDPPPPVEAAGSSLLYSREFYALVRQRLRPDGLLQQWLPGGDAATVASFSRALADSFPRVRALPSVLGSGLHYLAGLDVPDASAAGLAARLPPAAAADLLEWGPKATAEDQFGAVLAQEVSMDRLWALDPDAQSLEDDRPINEYYFVRRLRRPTPRRGDPWRIRPIAPAKHPS